MGWDGDWQNETLRRGHVYPVPLATETNWQDDGYRVNVIVVLDVSEDGYDSRGPVFSRVYTLDSVSGPDEARARTLAEFADQLYRTLAGG